MIIDTFWLFSLILIRVRVANRKIHIWDLGVLKFLLYMQEIHLIKKKNIFYAFLSSAHMHWTYKKNNRVYKTEYPWPINLDLLVDVRFCILIIFSFNKNDIKFFFFFRKQQLINFEFYFFISFSENVLRKKE